VVLHTTDYSETSLIVHAYSKHRGPLTFLVKGAKKSKKKRVVFSSMQYLQVLLYPSKKSDGLHLFKEAHMPQPTWSFQGNMLGSSLAFFMAEVLYQSLKNLPEDPPLFDFITASLARLHGPEAIHPCMPHVFLMELAQHLGFGIPQTVKSNARYFDLVQGEFVDFQPSENPCIQKEELEALKSLIGTDFDNLPQGIHKKVRMELLEQLLLFFEIHVPHFGPIKTIEILSAVLQVL